MLGFVVLNYKTWEKTIACVESIKNTYRKEKKIIVVDNKSPNDSYERLCEAFSSGEYGYIEVIQTERNGGFAYGNNVGIQVCVREQIKYAVVTNNDILFEPGSIELLLNDARQNNDAVLIAPKVLNTKRETITSPWKSNQSLIQFLGLKSASELTFKEEELTKLQKVYMVSGCCFLIDVDKFVSMGAIDEGTFLYMEEGTIAMAARNACYAIFYEPNALIIHDHGYTIGGGLFSDGEIIKSGLYYWKKYEQGSNFELCVIWVWFSLKSLIKIVLRRTNGKGFWKFEKDTFNKLKAELRAKY